ncbi:unnamed protein product [Didymodactylos carnosus]|uniref:Uncharacterized protein n=1 Tax=Didymodactylos carnosus TaxID=1234261 RepID=A0A815LR20_9BILA|nr:unnamed protein product [Didymodactylos carnosus]CAF4299579.1 unnamed protein product [Didymodactylos carnosus]
MSIEEGFRAIDQYIAKYDQRNRYGYCVQPVKTEHSAAGDTVDHLNPITFRLLHMFTHVMMMMLYQFKYIEQNENQLSYFTAHYEKDCRLIGDIISSPDDYPVWLYKIVNHMMNANIHISGILDTNQNVVQFEKHIEQTLVFKHIQSISNEIKQYKVAFIDFVRKENAEPIFNDFVNELAENEEKYTLLNFFSVTKINNATLDEFRSTFQLLPYARNLYPLTDYILQHLPEIENLSLLFPLVQFCNLLLDKFNHRISRDDAATNDIGFYLTNNQDNILSLAFEQFRTAWYQLTLKEVQYNCQSRKPDREGSIESFSKNVKLAFFLLNTSKDDSSICLLGCFQTLAKLQNVIVNYFRQINEPMTEIIENEKKRPTLVQKIKPEHTLNLNVREFISILDRDGFMVNHEYGKSKEVLYDFDQIESRLRFIIGKIRLIDPDKFIFFNLVLCHITIAYQFELYNQDVSLFNDIRRYIKQQSLSNNDKTKLSTLLSNAKADEIRKYLGSLDYVFTYPRNARDSDNTWTIRTFVENVVNNKAHLHEYVTSQEPFASIHLKYVISLYELVEELVFNEVMSNYVKQEMTSEACASEEEKLSIIDQFVQSTYANATTPQALKDSSVWMSVLKRIIIRVIAANVDLNVPLQIYLERTDMWSEDSVETYPDRDVLPIEIYIPIGISFFVAKFFLYPEWDIV